MLCLLLAFATRGFAHPANIPSATAKVQPDGRFDVEMRIDILAFALEDTPQSIGDGPMNALLDGPASTLQASLADARQRFQDEFAAVGDNGPGTVDTLDFPTLTDVQQARDSGIQPRLPVMLRIAAHGHLAPGARTISFRFPSLLGMVVLNTELPYQEPTAEPLDAGGTSTPLSLPSPTAMPPIASRSLLPACAEPKVADLTTKLRPPGPHPGGTLANHSRVAGGQFLLSAPRMGDGGAKPDAKGLDTKSDSPRPPIVSSSVRTITKPAHEFIHGTNTAANHSAVLIPPELGMRDRAPHPFTVSSSARTTSKSAREFIHGGPVAIATVVPRTSEVASSGPSLGTLIMRYVKMGFTHIVPQGLDHILFVLGLFLLSTRTKDLLTQITAFTVAHSLTLGLALYGIVRLPSSIVEPVIAASIAFVAIENLCTKDLKPWRPLVVFAFGLVHGMGFAGALKDLGLQRHDFLTALIGFNGGVELGQLSVVALAFLVVGWMRPRASYRRIVVIPASFAIAVVAVFWTVQRIWWAG